MKLRIFCQNLTSRNISMRILLIVALFPVLTVKPQGFSIGELRTIEVYSYKEGGKEQNFGYRIPALHTSNNGTLLAFAERRIGLHDHAQNDIVLRRSFDLGETWEPEQIVVEDGKNSLNDPCVVVLETGRILLMYQRFPYGVHARNSGWIQMADPGYDGPRNTKTFLVYSDDDGASWSEPREITKMVRASGKISVGSPGIGIQLKRGEYKGRIVLPLYETRPVGDGTRDWQNSVAYSDDNGETWKVSNNIPHYGHTGFGNEAQVVELSDGKILFIARNQGGQYRKYSESEDGGVAWSNMRLDFGLPGTACQGTVIRYRWLEDGKSIIVQASPANKYARNQGTVRISTDEGKNWTSSRLITPDYYAYSCLTKMPDGRIGLLYETERYRKINFTAFTVEWVMEGDPQETADPYFNIPLIDLDNEEKRQVIVDKEKGQYLGHPTTLLLEDNKTILTVYPKGHGRGPIVYKKSNDAGLTWSERIPTPNSWETSMEVPTLFRVEDKFGKKRVIMFSGLYPTRLAISEDDGSSWSELEPVGDWGGIVVMGCMTPLNTGKGHYMALFHDDMRFITGNGRENFNRDKEQFNSRMFTLYKTFSYDGGLTWSYPEEIVKSREIHICEPGIIRSPDGSQLAALLRENSRRDNSQIIFSNDEGKTWTSPRPLPNALTGDRHVLKYAHDGRLLVTFRDVSPFRRQVQELARKEGETNMDIIARKYGVGSPTEGDWVAWVGTYQDLLEGNEGQYRLRIKDNTNGWDTCYPGQELLPDGTFVMTTYGHWEKGESPYILSVRFKLEEIDELAEKLRE